MSPNWTVGGYADLPELDSFEPPGSEGFGPGAFDFDGATAAPFELLDAPDAPSFHGSTFDLGDVGSGDADTGFGVWSGGPDGDAAVSLHVPATDPFENVRGGPEAFGAATFDPSAFAAGTFDRTIALGHAKPEGSGIGPDPARLDALLERPTEHNLHDQGAVRDFVGGERVVNTDILGPLDTSHLAGGSLIFADVLRDVRESAATGEPVRGTLTNGSSPVTAHLAPYEIHLPRGASEERQIEVARDMTLSFLHGYEQNSVVLGGLGNRAAEWLGVGTSAFSTEDVVSNAVGVFWVEDLARENGVDALLEMPSASLTRYVFGQTALEAGNIMSIGPDTVTSFGNREYLPNFRHGHEQPPEVRRGSEVYRYLEERQDAYEAIGDFAPRHGAGWAFEPPPEPVVPHEGTLWSPTGGGW